MRPWVQAAGLRLSSRTKPGTPEARCGGDVHDVGLAGEPEGEEGDTVGLSASATAERVRRLEETGVITGYSGEVDPDRLGLPIAALVRLRYPNANNRPFHQLLATTPGWLRC
jgi:hypothetical protein